MNEYTFPTIFSKSSTGKIQQWTMFVEGNRYWTEAGQTGGKITKSKETVCKGKNKGKKNETSPEEQAALDARSKWSKKLDKNGFLTEQEARESKDKFFVPMTAQKFRDHNKKIEYPAYVQPKLDGIRCVIGKDFAITRNGKPHSMVSHIQKVLRPVFEINPTLVLDGELYNHDLKENFEGLVSLIRKSKLTDQNMKDAESKIQFHIYDLKTENPCDFHFRMSLLTLIHEKLLEEDEKHAEHFVKIVPTVCVQDEEDVLRWHDHFVNLGYEGAMVRNSYSLYEHKRSFHLQKVKVFMDDEFPLIGFEEGKGNKKGMAASAWVKLPNGQKCKVGIKGSEEFCQNLLSQESNLIGLPVTVEFFGYTQEGSLRFGKLKAIRNYE